MCSPDRSPDDDETVAFVTVRAVDLDLAFTPYVTAFDVFGGGLQIRFDSVRTTKELQAANFQASVGIAGGDVHRVAAVPSFRARARLPLRPRCKTQRFRLPESVVRETARTRVAILDPAGPDDAQCQPERWQSEARCTIDDADLERGVFETRVPLAVVPKSTASRSWSPIPTTPRLRRCVPPGRGRAPRRARSSSSTPSSWSCGGAGRASPKRVRCFSALRRPSAVAGRRAVFSVRPAATRAPTGAQPRVPTVAAWGGRSMSISTTRRWACGGPTTWIPWTPSASAPSRPMRDASWSSAASETLACRRVGPRGGRRDAGTRSPV